MTRSNVVMRRITTLATLAVFFLLLQPTPVLANERLIGSIDFYGLRKDADPDIPELIEARERLAELDGEQTATGTAKS